MEKMKANRVQLRERFDRHGVTTRRRHFSSAGRI
jgi:hypothetical protein